MTYEQYVDQVGNVTPGVPKRFCNDAVGTYKSHFHSMNCRNHGTQCAACGKSGAYWKCGVCDKALHWSDPLDKNVKRGSKGQKQNMITCALDYHDEKFFGLAYDDCGLIGVKGKGWGPPTEQMRQDNADHIMKLKRKFMLATWGVAEAVEDVAVAEVVEEGKTEE